MVLLAAILACGGGGGDDTGWSDYPPSYPGSKIIFVTSHMGSGDLKSWRTACSDEATGLEAADCICQEHADIWGDLSGTYKAWLSDSTTSAASRMTPFDGPYVNRRGERIADNWTQLTDGTLACTDIMNYNESGDESSTQFHMVWTGTGLFGDIQNPSWTCSDWTSRAVEVFGVYGTATGNTLGSDPRNGCWTYWHWTECDRPNRLYCVEQ
jgi:hypothetical protein